MSETFDINAEDNAFLSHYGILRKSGRYPWGSGGNTSQRVKSFFDIVDELKANGATNAQIAAAFSTPEHPFTSTDLQNARTIAVAERKREKIATAEKLREKGMSNLAIGKQMGLNESSVRALLAPGAADRGAILAATSNMLREQVEKHGAIDVGGGNEHHVLGGITRTRFDAAVSVLEAEGYKRHYVKIPQVGTGKMTTYKVLAKEDVKWSDMIKDPTLIKSISSQTDDKGRNWTGIQPPLTIDPKRVAVRYKEDGGDKADGVIYVRPGKDDLSLGGKNYAQVRIAVGDGHYLKGMAIYKEGLPKGVDLEFNTNKSFTGSKLDAMKKISDDPTNPFGSVVRQLHGPDGKPSSAMNIVNDEGTWDKWGRNLSSQMLSKQSPVLAKQQLDMLYERRKTDLEDIKKLTNPAIRRKLLEEFADGSDAAAVHLKAAAMPGQATRVILPVNSLKDNQVYAPGFKDGDRVVLIRYPHGGTFEIPELTVNNRHPEARKLLGTAPTMDAIGINAKVAGRLSGADFDGDTVLVIPQRPGREVKTTAPLESLKNFDPQNVYKLPDDAPRMKPKTKQMQMGDVSNLITDMTIKGASNDELARAVRHSMVVIDAEKHHLDYKRSARDHGIAALKKKYQGDGVNPRAGAATLISRKKQETDVPERKQGFRIDPETGQRKFIETGANFVSKKTGETVYKTQKVKKLDLTDDAHSMVSAHGGTKIERVYADHSNRMKDLANQARLEQVRTKSIPYSPSAKKAYSEEVRSLDAKLTQALKNRPLERNAQVIANGLINQAKAANPDMTSEETKKLRSRALLEGRRRTGAGKDLVEITDREWQAIQAGAISNNKLTKILNNTDIEKVRERATPREQVLMTSAKTARAQAMVASGFTQAEIAEALGVSLTTLKNGLV